MNQEKIGNFIAKMRKEKGMSQAELGERVGVTNKTVSRWENGNYLPDISIMQLLCQEFNIGINELLSGEVLTSENFIQYADANIIISLEEQKALKRKRQLSEFFEGGGTGILISAIFSPDGIRRTIAVLIAITMISVGWMYRKKC